MGTPGTAVIRSLERAEPDAGWLLMPDSTFTNAADGASNPLIKGSRWVVHLCCSRRRSGRERGKARASYRNLVDGVLVVISALGVLGEFYAH